MGGFGNFDSHYYHIFDANADNNNWGNPMKGHAVGTDIHPYSMRILYLIAYWDITGEVSTNNSQGGYFNNFSASNPNAFAGKTSWNCHPPAQGSGTYEYYKGFTFDASRVVPTSDEVRPYSMRVLYLIAYWETLPEVLQ